MLLLFGIKKYKIVENFNTFTFIIIAPKKILKHFNATLNFSIQDTALKMGWAKAELH